MKKLMFNFLLYKISLVNFFLCIRFFKLVTTTYRSTSIRESKFHMGNL